MTIRREELSTVDFSEVLGEGLIPVSTPGELLRQEFMEPHGLSANALAQAQALRVPTNRITGILNGVRGITADTALRLARFFGTSPEFWLGLQVDYMLRVAEIEARGH
jgi:addiction module HigA family antidote